MAGLVISRCAKDSLFLPL